MKPQYRKASHCIYDLKYHIVWITKYRKPVLSREIGMRVRDLVRMICASLDVEIVKGNVSRDHVHLLVSAAPTLSVSRLVQRMKGLTSRKLLMENRGLNKAFWGRHLWARGYFVVSTGNVTEEMIGHYRSRLTPQPKGKRTDRESFPQSGRYGLLVTLRAPHGENSRA
jgi:putative transposase